MTRASEAARQAVYRLLSDHERYTTPDVVAVGGSDGPRRARELRDDLGYAIEVWPMPGANGWHYYQLLRDGEERPVQTEMVLR